MQRTFGGLALGAAVLVACAGEGATRQERSTTRAPEAPPSETPSETPPSEPEVEPLPLVTAPPARAPLPPPGCRLRDADGQPGEEVRGLTFRVAFRGGGRRYARGEIVGLALSFSARTPDTFQLDAAEYDRSGRLHIDRYALEPEEGVVDPLADYFERGPIQMGGLRQMPMLGPRPRVIERDLDEYLQVRRPGRYTLRVATDRVTREGAPIVCASEPLELEILPSDDARDERSVREAARVLERHGRLGPGARTDADEHAARAAARTLRFLTTEAAAEAMVRRLAAPEGDALDGELVFGLFGSPHRARIVELMQETLIEPDAQVTTSFVDTLSRLAAQLERPGHLPPWPDDEASRLRWRRTEAAYLAHRRAVDDRFARSLLASLPSKRGAANDVAFATLLELAFRPAEEPPWIEGLRAQIGARLATMGSSELDRFLHARWLQIADRSLVAPLRAMADADDTEPSARALALSRLFELAPEEAQPRIEAEVRRNPVRLGHRARDALSVLVGPVPALDEALAAGVERLDHEQDLRAHLLARYGTAAILARVRAALASRRDASSSEAEGAYLAYFLRVDRERAVRELRARGAAAGTDLERRRFCATLAAAAGYLWDPVLEDEIVRLLASEDPHTVQSAAGVLRDHASARTEPALFSRLEAHHARHRARPAEANRGGPWQIEDALVSALLRGRGWHLDRAALERLRTLCLADSTTANVESALDDRPGPLSLTIFLHHDGSLAAHVDRYHFTSDVEPLAPVTAGPRRHFVLAGAADRPPRGARRVRARALDDLLIKLAQLEPGTELRVALLPADRLGAPALRASLSAWMRARGLRVVTD